MRLCLLLLVAILPFVAGPSSAVRAQDLSVDAQSSAGNTWAPSKKSAAQQGAKGSGISAAPPIDPPSETEPQVLDWSGAYAGVHGGALSSPGRSNP